MHVSLSLRTLAAVAAACVLPALPTPPAFAGVTPFPIVVENVEGAPVQLQVAKANLVDQEDGSRSLRIEYAVRNTGTVALGAQGWMLSVHPAGGELERQIVQAFSIDLGAGETGGATITLDEKTLGRLELGDLVVMTAHTAGYGRCRNADQTCAGAEARCHAYCNNPLGGPHEVLRQSCGNCRTEYDAVEKCSYTKCDFVCECEPSPWPDQRGWLDWNKL
jgi:hypothetical protein